MRTRAFFASAALLSTFISFSGKSEAATFTVNSVTGLINAMSTANDNREDDTIIVQRSLAYDTTPYYAQGPLALPPVEADGGHTLTIRANVANVSLSYRNSTNINNITHGRLLYVRNGAHLLLENLLFYGGDIETGDGTNRQTNSGGVVYVEWGELTLRDCRFTENRARLNGGAVFGIAASITATNCRFDANWGDGEGIDDDIGGGAIMALSCDLTLTDCTIEGNRSKGPGGGLLVYSNALEAARGRYPTNITHCTFRNNTSMGANGGGFACEDSLFTITDSLFEGNDGFWGAALRFRYTGPEITTPTPTYTEPVGRLIRCTFRNNGRKNGVGYNQWGAGIFSDGGDLDIKDSLFDGNKSEGGGGIYLFRWHARDSVPRLTLENSTFTRNDASVDGGGAIGSFLGADPGVYTEMRVTNCTFVENTASAAPSILTYGTAAITNCTFVNNLAGAPGNGIENWGSATTVKNCLFAGGTWEHIVNYGEGTVTSLGNNLSTLNSGILNHPTDLRNTNPLLDPSGLNYNGGLTPTVGLLRNSPALDRISGTPGVDFPLTDQRGIARPIDSTADIGAFEGSLNNAPIANDDNATTTASQAVTITVRSNDTDADGDTLSVTSVTQPAHGTATINTGGTVIYTPQSGFTGTDSFTYTISDGQGGTDTATVQVSVQAPVAPAKILLSGISLIDSSDTITTQVTLTNAGGVTATNVRLLEAVLGTSATLTTPLPIIASIAPGASATITLRFPLSAGMGFLKIKGTFTGGSFSASRRL